MAVGIEELAERLCRFPNDRGIIFLGDGVPVHRERLQNELLVNYKISFAPAHMNQQRAAALGTLAMDYYRTGRVETAAEHKPDYLRLSQAEREREERELAKKNTESNC